MFSFLADTAHAMGASGQADAQNQNPIVSFIPLILVMAVFYFLMIRPQQKQAKERKAMLDSVGRGDEIVTTGGLIGRVVEVSDEVLTVEIAQNVKVRVQRAAVFSAKKSKDG